jgi:hypothetical protein
MKEITLGFQQDTISQFCASDIPANFDAIDYRPDCEIPTMK